MAILGWVALPREEFWDTRENGEKIPGRLDPFWPEAMDRVEWYYRECFRRYRDRANVVAFVPTWGIYGEAGFTSFDAGRSGHARALQRMRQKRDLPLLRAHPTRSGGLNTDTNLCILFPLSMCSGVHGTRRQAEAESGGRPVGMWQELYPVMVISGTWWKSRCGLRSRTSRLHRPDQPHPAQHTAETMASATGCSLRSSTATTISRCLREAGRGAALHGMPAHERLPVQTTRVEERARRVEFDAGRTAFGRA